MGLLFHDSLGGDAKIEHGASYLQNTSPWQLISQLTSLGKLKKFLPPYELGSLVKQGSLVTSCSQARPRGCNPSSTGKQMAKRSHWARLLDPPVGDGWKTERELASVRLRSFWVTVYLVGTF